MLTMGNLYGTIKQTIEQYGNEIEIDRMEFLTYFIPDDLKAAVLLKEKLEEIPSYGSSFFNGNIDRRGLNGKVTRILNEFSVSPGHFLSEIAAAAELFLSHMEEITGKNALKDVFLNGSWILKKNLF